MWRRFYPSVLKREQIKKNLKDGGYHDKIYSSCINTLYVPRGLGGDINFRHSVWFIVASSLNHYQMS